MEAVRGRAVVVQVRVAGGAMFGTGNSLFCIVVTLAVFVQPLVGFVTVTI